MPNTTIVNTESTEYINPIELYDISTRTLLGAYPGILNKNNDEIERLFSSIYDFDKQYVKTSVVSKGLVKANTGQFTNLYVTRNVHLSDDSKKQDFLDVSTDHRRAVGRFSQGYAENSSVINAYAHDADMIFYESGKSLRDKFDTIDSSMATTAADMNVIANTLVNHNKSITMLFEEIADVSAAAVGTTSAIDSRILALESRVSTMENSVQNLVSRLNRADSSINSIVESINAFRNETNTRLGVIDDNLARLVERLDIDKRMN